MYKKHYFLYTFFYKFPKSQNSMVNRPINDPANILGHSADTGTCRDMCLGTGAATAASWGRASRLLDLKAKEEESTVGSQNEAHHPGSRSIR